MAKPIADILQSFPMHFLKAGFVNSVLNVTVVYIWGNIYSRNGLTGQIITQFTNTYIDGLVQDWGDSIANALESLRSYT